MCFFFFSSRRRHTRWPRDWSSDVCSSDLAARAERRENLVGTEANSGNQRHLGSSPAAQSSTTVIGAPSASPEIRLTSIRLPLEITSYWRSGDGSETLKRAVGVRDSKEGPRATAVAINRPSSPK